MGNMDSRIFLTGALYLLFLGLELAIGPGKEIGNGIIQKYVFSYTNEQFIHRSGAITDRAHLIIVCVQLILNCGGKELFGIFVIVDQSGEDIIRNLARYSYGKMTRTGSPGFQSIMVNHGFNDFQWLKRYNRSSQ